MDKELASFHTYLFSLCVNAAAAQATSTGNRQLKLTRRSWLPAEQYCQVEQASTAPAQTSWHTGLISLAMIATLPTYPVLYSSFCGSSYSLQLSRQRLDYTKNKPDWFQYWKRIETQTSLRLEIVLSVLWHLSETKDRNIQTHPSHALSPRGIISLHKETC